MTVANLEEVLLAHKLEKSEAWEVTSQWNHWQWLAVNCGRNHHWCFFDILRTYTFLVEIKKEDVKILSKFSSIKPYHGFKFCKNKNQLQFWVSQMFFILF